ncbi:MAG: PilZ domain-containing protein [Elusimicrobia bacterium]|nr:PilZ domain-containing protein [Elusimicrobiota bacterium]
MADKDNRKHRRIPYTLVFDVYGAADAPQSRGKAALVDLSEVGAGVETEVPLKKGETIFFKLTVPLDVEARVVYIKENGKRYRYGIRFSKISLFDRWRIRRLIQGHGE